MRVDRERWWKENRPVTAELKVESVLGECVGENGEWKVVAVWKRVAEDWSEQQWVELVNPIGEKRMERIS
jgi:hypothetical protein